MGVFLLGVVAWVCCSPAFTFHPVTRVRTSTGCILPSRRLAAHTAHAEPTSLSNHSWVCGGLLIGAHILGRRPFRRRRVAVILSAQGGRRNFHDTLGVSRSADKDHEIEHQTNYGKSWSRVDVTMRPSSEVAWLPCLMCRLTMTMTMAMTMTMTMTHSEKSHIRRMKAWPYRQECRGHDPTKKNLFY